MGAQSMPGIAAAPGLEIHDGDCVSTSEAVAMDRSAVVEGQRWVFPVLVPDRLSANS